MEDKLGVDGAFGGAGSDETAPSLVGLFRSLLCGDVNTVTSLLSSGANANDVLFEIHTDSLCSCAEAFETLVDCPLDIGEGSFIYGSTVSLEVWGVSASETDLSTPCDYTIEELESLRRNSLENVRCSYSRYSDEDDEEDTLSIDGSDTDTEVSNFGDGGDEQNDSYEFKEKGTSPANKIEKEDSNEENVTPCDIQQECASTGTGSGVMLDNSNTSMSSDLLNVDFCDRSIASDQTISDSAADDLNQMMSSLFIVGKKIGKECLEMESDGESEIESSAHASQNCLHENTCLSANAADVVFDDDNDRDLPQLEWLKYGYCPHLYFKFEHFSEDLNELRPVIDVIPATAAGHNDTIKSSSKCVGLTPLHIAAAQGFTDVVKFLLSRECDPNISTKETNNTPLHLAAMKNHPEIIDILLTAKSDAYTANSSGDTPLHIAVEMNHTECASIFIRHGVSINVLNQVTQQSPLTCAILHNNESLVAILLQAGGQSIGLECDSTSGWTPIHQAACAGAQQCLELLLENGADPNQTNRDGETPLHLAASNGFSECVQSLIDAGAVCKIANSWIVGDNQTPLMLAVYHNYPDVVRILLRHDGVTQASEYGDNVMHYAAYRGCLEVVEGLLNAGADVNVKGHLDATPIWYAVHNCEIVQCLLKEKADASTASKGHDLDNMGTCVYRKTMTPLEVALQEGYFDSAEVLLRAGYSVGPHCWLVTGKIPRRFCAQEYRDVIRDLSLLARSATPLTRLRRSRIKKSEQISLPDVVPPSLPKSHS